MVHVTDVGHTCIIMLVLPSKFTLNKMKGIVQGNVISTGSFLPWKLFLQCKHTLTSGEWIHDTVLVMWFLNPRPYTSTQT